jgi:hypothetical protein
MKEITIERKLMGNRRKKKYKRESEKGKYRVRINLGGGSLSANNVHPLYLR